MNFDLLLAPCTLNFNDKLYVIPRLNISNPTKFKLLRQLMTQYTPQEFLDNFDDIYDSKFEFRPICYILFTIYQGFMQEIENGFSVSDIVSRFEREAKRELGRKNSSRCHLQFIGLVIMWLDSYKRDKRKIFVHFVSIIRFESIKRTNWVRFFNEGY